MRHRIALLLAAALLAPACADEGPRAAPALSAALVAGNPDPTGRLVLRPPFSEEVDLRLAITNRGDAPVQVGRSSFPCFTFAKLAVVRVGADGSRTAIPVHFDLYPNDDLEPPVREYVTLLPGKSMERSLDVLVREGYGLDSFAKEPRFGRFAELRERGFGELTEPGEYELTGAWSPEPTWLDGAPCTVWSGEEGRDETVPLYAGPPLRTAPLRVLVEGPTGGLEAKLVARELDSGGRLRLRVPFEEVGLSIRVTNRDLGALQAARSSYPCYRFAKLAVARIEAGGSRVRVPVYFDLYPTKDMKAPTLEYVTLEPGESFERDLGVLVREGYGLRTIGGMDRWSPGLRSLTGRGFGAMRTAGEYELTGIYAPEPTTLDGGHVRVWSGGEGRDVGIPLWNGPALRTDPVRAVVIP